MTRSQLKPSSLIQIGLVIAAFLLTCCGTRAPSCPPIEMKNQAELPERVAVSAGCLVVRKQQILLIKNNNGTISLPGGSAKKDEPANCTAHRETWEETGFDVTPLNRIRVNNNGFQLYSCALDPNLTPTMIEKTRAPFRLEIRQTLWLSPTQFDQHSWRYPEIQLWLKQWLATQKDL